MNKILNATFIRLDENMQNLAQNALAQIILKILYSGSKQMSENDINAELSKAKVGKRFNEQEIVEILSKQQKNGVECSMGKYSLTKAKRKEIETAVIASKNRTRGIIDHYFDQLNTDRSIIEEWLIDITLRFFEVHSDDWISDLMERTSHIRSKRESIVAMIASRTKNYKGINDSDKTELPKRFFDFINTSMSEVDEYLWEYGTSAFAAKLIRTTHGVDTMTLETFKNSHCILDTNILMFIALENRYKDAFKAIEKVFKNLDIRVGILYITKQEYESKIGYQRMVTLNNLEKLGREITTIPNDDFTKAAQQRHCKTRDDFIRFFDYDLKLPKIINNSVHIQLLDNSKKLVDVVDKARNDEKLKKDLNEKRVLILGRDKSAPSLSHDAGLIEGVNYLRNDPKTSGEKFFILSEDVAVNQYSKGRGFVHNLPLSIKVSTLINLLAINNGDELFNASDYAPLFANIIRMGLTPAKDTFRQSELYEYSQMDDRLGGLSAEIIEQIVREMHKKSFIGVDQKDLLRDLKEMVTKGGISTGVKLQKTEQELDDIRKVANDAKQVLKNRIKAEVEKEYDSLTSRMKWKRRLKFLGIAFILIIISYFGISCFTDSKIFQCVISIIPGVVSGLISYLFTDKSIEERIQKRDACIKDMAEKRFNNELTNHTR